VRIIGLEREYKPFKKRKGDKWLSPFGVWLPMKSD
jgi:hypothetical protein